MPAIIRNNAVIKQQSDSMKKRELSNVTLLTQQTPVFGTWYSIDPNLSEVVEGFRTVEEWIGPASRVKYNKIEGLPVYFSSEFASSIDFDNAEAGTTVSFQLNGTVLPNSVQPKGNEFFVPNMTSKPTLLRVTDYHYNEFKENPFIEISFDLASRDQATIDALNKQIVDDFIFIVSSIGADNFTVIEKSSYNKLIAGTQDYIALVNLYNELFFHETASVFTFKTGGVEYEDRVFNNFLSEKQIITLDPVLTFARSNMEMKVPSVFLAFDPIESPIMHTAFDFIIKKRASRFTQNIDQIKFNPEIFDTRYHDLVSSGVISPSLRQRICWYSKTVDDTSLLVNVLQFTPVFLARVIANNIADLPANSLQVAIIKLYNSELVNFETVEVVDDDSIENYYLLPILLYYYRKLLETFR